MLVGRLESVVGQASVARTGYWGTSCNGCESHAFGDNIASISYRDENSAPVASNHNAFATLSITYDVAETSPS